MEQLVVAEPLQVVASGLRDGNRQSTHFQNHHPMLSYLSEITSLNQREFIGLCRWLDTFGSAVNAQSWGMAVIECFARRDCANLFPNKLAIVNPLHSEILLMVKNKCDDHVLEIPTQNND